MNWIILVSMIFCHIIDDYYLQGILASMKQRRWWNEHAPDYKYRNDYIMALAIHSMSWAFMIMLPLFIDSNFQLNIVFSVVWIGNTLIHSIVDNAKANLKYINLIQDQLIHIAQIVITFIFYTYSINIKV